MHAEQLPVPGTHDAHAAQAAPAGVAAGQAPLRASSGLKAPARPAISWPDLALPPINLHVMPRLSW